MLPALLSDGAGPHLLDASGTLILVVAPHPRLSGACVAMGPAEPAHRMGLVAPAQAGAGWRWTARADVMPARRVAALDEIDAVADAASAREWAARWGALA